MKKIVSLFLAISMLLTLALRTVIAQDINFSDLIANGTRHWAYDTVMEAANRNIINGYTDGTFRPNNNVEVDAYIKMVVAALGNNLQNGNDYWASTYINKAIELKLIDGNEYNTYRRAITREEAAKIIVNALAVNEQLPDEQTISKIAAKVPDYNKISDKYKQHVLIAYTTGLITGDTKGYFKPQNNITRAEAATVIMRLLDKELRKPILTEDEVSTELPELLKTDEEVWGRDNIVKITSLAEYQLKDGRLYFTDEPYFKDLLPKETLNPNINKQLHDLVKVLIDDNHYVRAFYSPESKPDLYGTIIPSSAVVMFSKGQGYAYNNFSFFQFGFFDKNPLPKGETISLLLDRLWWEKNTDGTLYKPSKDGWSTPFYSDKLKKSIIAVFGEEYGAQINQYIQSIYMDERTKQDPQITREKTKTVGNIKIDFHNEGSALYFYFTLK